MEEKLTIDNNGRKFIVAFYCSPRWYDLILSDGEGDNFYSKMLIRLDPEALREIADSFYSWAEYIESEQS